jgi:hypothetical protein
LEASPYRASPRAPRGRGSAPPHGATANRRHLDDLLARHYPKQSRQPHDLPDVGISSTATSRRTVGGAPGASALAEYHRRRQLELDAWRTQLPAHLALVVCTFIVSWFIGWLVTGPLPNSLVWAPATGWALSRCRFRASAGTRTWKTGARGERATARRLRPLEQRGWIVLHDLPIPESTANVDHIAIGPGGVFVIDSKRWKGYAWVDGNGHAWRGSYTLQPTLETLWWETAQIAQHLQLPVTCPVRAVICLHRASTLAGGIYADGIAIATARDVQAVLETQSGVLMHDQIAIVAEQIQARFPAATCPSLGT